jgi:hypothetical protein
MRLKQSACRAKDCGRHIVWNTQLAAVQLTNQ